MTSDPATFRPAIEPAGPWIATRTGRRVYPLDPRPEQFHLFDIAVGLARRPRWGGQSETPYSVAEHCLDIASRLPYPLKAWGLMHDAAEAYIGDVPAPLKAVLWINHRDNTDRFEHFEEQMLRAIAARFRLPWPIPQEVHEADQRQRATEKRDLFPPGTEPFPGCEARPYVAPVRRFDNPAAAFLRVAHDLLDVNTADVWPHDEHGRRRFDQPKAETPPRGPSPIEAAAKACCSLRQFAADWQASIDATAAMTARAAEVAQQEPRP